MAAYAPISLSLDTWDRNHLGGETISMDLHLFNSTSTDQRLQVQLRVQNGWEQEGEHLWTKDMAFELPPFDHGV